VVCIKDQEVNHKEEWDINSYMKKILFRVDSSSSIGHGHIMRSLVLAKQFKNSIVYFATLNLDGNINYKIENAGYKIIPLKNNSLKELILIIDNYNINQIIFDNYDIDYKFEKKVKTTTNIKVMVLDDFYQKHYCDILLNHNISAKKSRYKGLVPKNTKLLCGKKYTLIRDEFKNIQPKKKNYPPKNILIAMGGSDILNLTPKIIKVLQNNFDFKIDVITTDANKNINLLKNIDNINLHVNTTKMALLINNADLAIISPSVILHEVIYLKTPFIAIKTANNQIENIKYLKRKNFNILNKFNKNRFISYFII